jgi:hypothetical protein
MFKKTLVLAATSLALASCIGHSNSNSSNLQPVVTQNTKSNTMAQLLEMNKKHLVSNSMLTKFEEKVNLLSNNYETPVRVGYGFDGRTGMSNGYSCLANSDDPNSISISNPEGTVNFSSNVSSSLVSDLLSVHVDGNLNIGVFSASVAASYARDAVDTRNTLNFNYFQTIGADAIYNLHNVIGNDILSKSAQNLLASGMDKFTSICGDSVIQSAKVGAVLVVDVAIQFSSSSLKQKFEGSANGSFLGIGSVAGKFTDEQDNLTKGATLLVKAYQRGGDPTKLANIFGNPDPQGSYNIVKCGPKDIQRCQDMINDIISYAQHDFQTNVNFKNQDTLYTYQYNVKAYTRLGVEAKLPVLTPEQQAARDYLTTSITQDREMLNYLRTYVNQSFFNDGNVDYVSQNNMKQAIKDYTTMINEYNNYDILDSCYGDTENINTRCVYAASQVKSMRNRYIDSINFAHRMAITIVADTVIGQIVFIPINTGTIPFGTPINSAQGVFIAYLPKTDTATTPCLIDTTTDYQFFKKYHPDLGSQSCLVMLGM